MVGGYDNAQNVGTENSEDACWKTAAGPGPRSVFNLDAPGIMGTVLFISEQCRNAQPWVAVFQRPMARIQAAHG
jgi:hypothetical protein